MVAANKVTPLCGLGVLLLSIGQLTFPRLNNAPIGADVLSQMPVVATVQERNVSLDMNSTVAGLSNSTGSRTAMRRGWNESSSQAQAIRFESAAAATAANTGSGVSARNAKPRMVLHIGPYKHGTTFLQCSMSTSGYKILEEDNYVYIGTCNCISHRAARKREICIGHSADSLRSRGDDDDGRFQPELLRILPKLLAQGRNAMIVWEYLSDIGQPWLTEFIQLLSEWDLRVIVAYRPAYEFLPSFLGQVQRPYLFRERYRTWPSKGGHAIIPFDMYSLEELVDLQVDLRYQVAFKRMKNRSVHPTEYARRLWKRSGHNETILIDMAKLGSQSPSGGDPLLIHLFCSVLDDTPTTCAAARNNTITGGVENSRFPINYDLLAVAAAEKGVLSTSIPRTVAWTMIQQRQESVLNKTAADFPLVCPSNSSMQELLQLSIASERNIFAAGANLDTHLQRFRNAVEKRKFCSIDTDAVLQDPEWVSYLQVLPQLCRQRKCRQMEI